VTRRAILEALGAERRRLAEEPRVGDVWTHRTTGSEVHVDGVSDTEVTGWTEGGTRPPGRFRASHSLYERWVAA
jgi:hypothetical protein